MKYYEPGEIKRLAPLAKLLDPKKFISDMVMCGEIELPTGDYGKDCSFLCHTSVAWMLLQIEKTPYFNAVKVCRGWCAGWEHSWLKFGEYYLDITLTQFEKEAPPLAIVRFDEGKDLYRPEVIMTPDEWIKAEAKKIGREYGHDKV